MTTPSDAPEVSPAESGLVIRLFGSMRVLVHGRPLARLRTHKALQLLALLTLRGGRPVERAWLAGTLWPDVDQENASANLRPVLTVLRKALGEEGVRLQSPDRYTVLLDVAGAGVDLRDFDQAISSGNLSALRHAVDLYPGPLLEGMTEEWVLQGRETRELHYMGALHKLADAALSTGDYAEATRYWRLAVSQFPLWEAARRGLMAALAEGGDSNAALQVYREFVRTLQRNGDRTAVPNEETTALYQRIRTETRQKATASATRNKGAAEAAPSQIFGCLPHVLTELIGREEERFEVAAQLHRSRLVTLTGPGGIGKTRLALAVARDAVPEYPDGVWLVSLDAIADPDLVSQAVAGVLKVKEEPGRPLLQTLAMSLVEKRLLLVLDNCEQVLDAVIRVTSHLLQECSGVRVLATSRETMGVTGEVTWQVPALTVPDPERLPPSGTALAPVVVEFEAVRLFIERAQAVQNTFLLTEGNARPVAILCSLLEGVPLAIELVAAWSGAATVEQIAERLGDRLSGQLTLLRDDNRPSPSRQQTLRATLDWSYDLLNGPERLLLQRLSVFRGGWCLEAAEAVVGVWGEAAGDRPDSRYLTTEPITPSQTIGPNVLDLLTSLVDKSLVEFEEQVSGGRYRLLEMIRQYAAERLTESGAEREVRVAHRQYLCRLADEAVPLLDGTEQEHWLERLDAEHDNFRATLAWDGPDVEADETALRIAGALWRFWEIRGYPGEGRQHLRRALDRTNSQEETMTRARALTGAGALALVQGDLAAAREQHRQSLEIYRKFGEQYGIASSLCNQGIVALHQGDLTDARSLMEEGLSIQRELGELTNMLRTLCSLGNLARSLGDYKEAYGYFEESLGIGRQCADLSGTAYALEGLGVIKMLAGEYAAAQTYIEECLHLRRQLGNRYGMALCLGNLAMMAQEREDAEEARLLFEECLGVFRELGDRYGTGHTLINLGMLAHEQGDASRAVEERLEEGLALFRESGEQEGTALALCCLGRVVSDHGDLEKGQEYLRESLLLNNNAGNRLGVAQGLEGFAGTLLAQAHAHQAVLLWGAAHALRESIAAPLSLAERRIYEQRLAQAQVTLGEAGFATAWEEGSTLLWGQAVAHVLGEPTLVTLSDDR